MPGPIFQIARTGAAATRASLELVAQNIANASNPDYSRRTLELRESVGVSPGRRGVLNGVRIEGISRASTQIVQQQARTSASELARADAELQGLRDTELALEQSRLFEGLVEFEAVLTQLEGNPLEPALRTNALETARQLAGTFQFANTTLGTARTQVQDAASVTLDEANLQAAELARINQGLSNVRPGTVGEASLLDARDAALRNLSESVGITASFDERGAVSVRLADGSGGAGPLLVDRFTATPITSTTNPDGTLAFALGSVAVAPARGALAGQAAALEAQADFQNQLDTIASDVIARSNAAQAAGADQDGNPGQPLFTGANAGDIALGLNSGRQLATAPAGSPAGSTNSTNLANFAASIGATDGPVATMDTLLLGLSSRIAAQDVTRTGLSAIAQNAEATLLIETGVDLDTEAANLVRLQQAFEANSRVLQVASDIFDTLLALR
ncbi:MAG: flagellar hook-associated protein FlgK [Pseudomonadota bacterium]